MIRLGVGAFDPLAAPLPASKAVPLVAEATLPSNTPLYFLAQVQNRRFAEAWGAINLAGGTIDSVLPDDAYVVRATTGQRAVVDAANAIRWTGFFQPSWRVAPSLSTLSGTVAYRVFGYRKDPNVLGLAAALGRIKGVTVVSDGGVTVDVKATAAQLGAMAVIPYVDWITPSPAYVPLNYNARWVVDTGVRDLFSATADNGVAPTRLNGAGQTAADADTPLNYTNNSAGFAHVAFRDGCDAQGQNCMLADYNQVTPGQVTPAAMTSIHQNHAGTNHRKMVAYFDLGGSGIDSIDGDAHGSHTAGTIDGDAGTPGVYDGNDGLAPAAHHVHQNIMTQAGGLNLPGGLALPTDYYQLFRQAYRPDNPGSVSTTGHAATDYTTGYASTKDARTHNNSYGSIVNIADTGDAIVLDQFVWDHEDMDIAVAAGNGGPGAGTISSPGLAKNDFASAATQNGRQPMVSMDSITNFSSHGPTGDGRFGITVADPGEIVVSVKGGTADGYHYEQGTSMSTPVLTGILTLVRQYFYDGFGPASAKGTADLGFANGARNLANRYNPSAALVKATLVAGAQRMRGWYSGDDGSSQQGSGQPELSLRGQYPSAGQGFGRVNLDTSLAFAGGPLNGWYHDVYRDDAEAFQLTDAGATRSYTIQVDAGKPLNVALAYTDAPNDLVAGTPSLVNKLNLTVTGPNGATYIGNNFNTRATPSLADAEVPNQPAAAPDAKNNVEKVRIASPAAGSYTINVRGTLIRTAGQGFGLAANGAIHTQSGSFVPHEHQVDLPGSPTISNIQATPVSADTVRLSFNTNEPTTATATGTVKATPHTFGDVAQLTDADRYFGIGSALVEESPNTAGKLVLGTKHEMFLTGFNPGSTRTFTIAVQDLGGSTPVTAPVAFTTPDNIFQTVQAKDQAILTKSGTGFQWEIGKQFYAGHSPATLTGAADAELGAFMFRIPGSVDPSTITGASVEMVSGHDWASEVSDDPIYTLDLLDNAVKPAWGTQTYAQIESAAKLARVTPETDYHVGGNQRYSFTFGCNDLQRLKDSLGTVDGNGQRTAPFRWDATDTNTSAVFSMEFGFNRRSKGVDLRPKLILRTANSNNEPPLTLCDPSTPPPTISSLGVHPGLSPDSAIVTWKTNVDSDSLVLFRQGNTGPWTQVATPSRTKIHQVWIQGVDASKTYEFGVRSTACNGATTTDDNAGAGYLLFRPQPVLQPRLSFYFHGTAADDANRLASAPTATFNSQAPTGSTDITQSSQNVLLNDPTIAGDQNSPYWISPVGTGTAAFTGTITGNIHLHWWWSSANPTATMSGSQMDITVWADLAPGTTGQQPIGSASPRLNMGTTPVLNDNDIPVTGTVHSKLIIQATPHFVDTGQANVVHYDSTTAPSMFTIPVGPLPPPPPGGSGPKVGPMPPFTAGDSGLQLGSIPADGMPSAADRAAGTGLCDSRQLPPMLPEVPYAALLPLVGLAAIAVPIVRTRRRGRQAA